MDDFPTEEFVQIAGTVGVSYVLSETMDWSFFSTIIGTWAASEAIYYYYGKETTLVKFIKKNSCNGRDQKRSYYHC
jgi:hypothetical protein